MDEQQGDKKASVLIENKETRTSISGLDVGDQVETEDASHAVLTALPVQTEVGSSSEHIHVQLFEAPVIQITSAVVDTGNKNDGSLKRRTYEGNKRVERGCVVGGEIPTGGSITLLTSDGKTYILPQSIASGGNVSTGYLIAEEVLNAEEVIQSNNVLHEEQMLTISPPPPSALEFPATDARTPDALAIATSEVFSENYIPLPLEAPSPITGTRAFHFKAEVEGDGRQNSIINDKPHARIKNCEQKECTPLVEPNVITTTPLFCTGEVSSWPGNEVKEQLLKKSDLAKREGETLGSSPTSIDGQEPTEPLCAAERIDHDAGRSAKQLDHVDSVNYSIISKWYGLRHEIAADDFMADYPLNANVCSKITGQKKAEAENQVGIEDNLVSFPVDDQKPPVSKKSEEILTAVNPTVDPGTLRRSSRIRRTKKVTSEVQHIVYCTIISSFLVNNSLKSITIH